MFQTPNMPVTGKPHAKFKKDHLKNSPKGIMFSMTLSLNNVQKFAELNKLIKNCETKRLEKEEQQEIEQAITILNALNVKKPKIKKSKVTKPKIKK